MVDVFEMTPELAGLMQLQHDLDYAEAGPKAPYDHLVYLGVEITSRFDALSEYEHMKAVLAAMPEILARRLQSIFCDSKACCAYAVVIRDRMNVPFLSEAIFDAFASLGGFNDLYVEYEGRCLSHEDGYWPGENGFD